MRATDIAKAVGGEFQGGADPEISGIAPLDRAGASDLGLYAAARYAGDAAATRAGAILVARALAAELPAGAIRIVVPDPHDCLPTLLPLFYPPVPEPTGIHPTAILHADVKLGADVSIGAYAVIGAGTVLGTGVRVGAHCALGRDCVLGDAVYLHPHVTLYDRTRLGARTVLHAGVRIGVDGFGYVAGPAGAQKVPHVGSCVIGSDVEIGGNTSVDRGSIGDTEIGDGCKIDNLVHIGHNVRIGAHSMIAGQVGMSGSVRIGRGVRIGGQAGLNGHITIGDGATIAGQAGVFSDVPAGATYSGYPARPHKEALRAQAALFRLPVLLKRLRIRERDDREGGDGEA